MKNILLLIIVTILVGQDCYIHSYVIYVLVVALFFISDFKTFFYARNNLVLPLVFLSIYSLLQFWNMSQRTLLEAGLLLLGILCFTFRKAYQVNIKLINIIIGIVLLFNIINRNHFDINYSNYINSDIGYEANMISFILPFFFYYWMRKKDFLFVLIDISLVLMSGKRIALLACFVGFLYFILRRWLEKSWFPYFMVGLNLFYLFVSFLLAYDYFDNLVFQWFDMSINQFTMGRFELYKIVFERIKIFDDYKWLYGIGLGNVEQYIKIGHTSILHNDILRVFCEFGIVVFILFFYLIYKVQYTYQWGYILIWNILLMTDNTLIYVPVVFSIGLFIDTEFIDSKHHYSNFSNKKKKKYSMKQLRMLRNNLLHDFIK